MSPERSVNVFRVGVALLVILLTMAAVPSRTVEAAEVASYWPAPRHAEQTAGTFAAPPSFGAGTLAPAVFMGGTVDQLLTAAQTAGAAGIWLQHPSGSFELVIVGSPAFLIDAVKAK